MTFTLQPPRFSAGNFKIIGHRGAQISGIPGPSGQRRLEIRTENTLPAFTHGARLGIHGQELDVIVTADQQLAVVHDDWLERLHYLPEGKQTARETSMTQLKTATRFNLPGLHQTIQPKLSGLSTESVTYLQPDAPIPTLEEVLDATWAIDPKSHFYIEIKSPGDALHAVDTGGAEEKLARLIRTRNLYDRVTVISFNPECLRKIKDPLRGGDPKIKTGLDFVFADLSREKNWGNIAYLLTFAKTVLQVDTILPPLREATQSLIRQSKALGLEVLPWVWKETCQEELREGIRLQKMGADGMITNCPELLKQHLATAGKQV